MERERDLGKIKKIKINSVQIEKKNERENATYLPTYIQKLI